VYAGATMGSETTAAATGAVGRVRRDPMPCCPLRLQYRRLFPALDHDAAFAERNTAHLSRQLVPQGRAREIPVARVRRESANSALDDRPGTRPRARQGNADRLDAAATTTSNGKGSITRGEKFDHLQAFDREAWHGEVMEHEEWLMGLRDHLPPENHLRTRVADLPAAGPNQPGTGAQ